MEYQNYIPLSISFFITYWFRFIARVAGALWSFMEIATQASRFKVQKKKKTFKF